MMNTSLVSIITPVFNGESTIQDCISSVMNQTYGNFEHLIIDDGSSDGTSSILDSYNDPRIRVFRQENMGVSHARNIGLKNMKGNYFCFLDADDTFFERSIEIRLEKFMSNPQLEFVDGVVQNFKRGVLKSEYHPKFRGTPTKELALLNDSCFFGITWMIKRQAHKEYKFDTKMSHGEDLLFYLELCSSQSLYDYVDKPIYRRNLEENSAMSNIEALEMGYNQLLSRQILLDQLTTSELTHTKKKVRKIIFKSYLSQGKILEALRTYFSKN